MSRRETIIIAVLMNAGLLIVLFTSALKSNNGVSEMAAAPVVPSSVELSLRPEIASAPVGDEVDQVLKQFVNVPQTTATPSSAPSAESTPNFAQDLTAIAFSPTPSAMPTETASASVSLEVPQTASAATDYKEVKVKKGDFLDKIARSNHTTVEEIMKANQLQSTRLKIGQVLRVPVKEAKKKTSPGAAQVVDNAKYYTVKNGDSPWTIAVKNHLKVEELLKLNQLDEEKARHLKPGDQLRIR